MTASGIYQMIERHGIEASVEVNPHATFPGIRDREAVGA
jgi:hypothetical protein